MRRSLALALLAGMLAATPALAQQDLRFCPNRPSLGSSGCITDPGHVQAEVSGIDWERDDSADQRQDTILAGDLLLRFGLAPTTELQVGWTPYGQVRTRDKLTGAVDTTRGVGDVVVGLRQNISHPDGKGFSVAIQPFVSVPVGRTPIGAGDWGGGVVLPVSYELSDKLTAEFTGELDAAVDEDGHGRHDAYSGIVGLGYAVSDTLTATGEFSLERDDDPADAHTEALAAASLAWQPGKTYQIDILAVAGLNHDAPDFRLVTGGAIVF